MIERALSLRLHGERVAWLVERAGAATAAGYELRFDPSWVERVERPVLSLAAVDWRLDAARYFPGRPPPFLTNLLPERGGALRRRISRAAGVDEHDEFSLLEFAGRDMSGAISAVSEAAPDGSGRTVEHPPVSSSLPVDRLRWSLGGMQLKFSVDRGDRLTLPVGGRGGRWILKVPERGRPGLPRAELAAMEWAREAGFDVPATEIVDPREVDGLPSDACEDVHEALLVRRFDRLDDHSPVHMEELISVLHLHPEDKYPAPHGPKDFNLVVVGRLVRRFAGPGALLTFLGRVVFDVLVGNGDAHLKNWAFFLPDGRSPALAPAYDVFPTVLYGYPEELALPLTRERAFRAVDEGRIRQFAGKVGGSPDEFVAVARRTVERAADTFEVAMERAGLPRADRATLKRHWETLPLTRRA